MITIASLVVFLAFYTLYYTSKRATLSYDLGFEKWMQRNPRQTKITGLFLLVITIFYVAFYKVFRLWNINVFYSVDDCWKSNYYSDSIKKSK
ncbi:hypothetical protein ACQ9BO_03905 [Flavobacterium sp. P21]|uniref:hypothetical protein n=1 Tax=Flavobacterium sp. P21 TaxID=3423948 RepID=UPI003D66537B